MPYHLGLWIVSLVKGEESKCVWSEGWTVVEGYYSDTLLPLLRGRVCFLAH